MDTHARTIELGTDPDNLHEVARVQIFGVNKKVEDWRLSYDETVGEDGILPNIRFNPTKVIYEAVVLSWKPRLLFRIMPWLIKKTPNTRHNNLTVRVIPITAAQYEELYAQRF